MLVCARQVATWRLNRYAARGPFKMPHQRIMAAHRLDRGAMRQPFGLTKQRALPHEA